MAKIATSVRLEEDLINRLDAVAEAKGVSRSELIERILQTQVKDEESFIRQLDNPLVRLIIRGMMSNPKITKTIAKMAGEELTDERLKRGKEKTERMLRLAAERRAGKSAQAIPELEAE